MAKKSVDLTTLSGWANLAPGNHTIKIVAKGTGYIDSEKSAGVTVNKAASTVTLEAGTYKFVDSPTEPSDSVSDYFNFTYKISNGTTKNGYAIRAGNYYGFGIIYEGGSVYEGYGYTTNKWGYVDIDAGEVYSEDNTIQTITLSTDQQVSPEFYNWAITQGNLVKQVEPAAYTDCLTFTGESSEFTLKATNKDWDGTLEWSTDHNTWTTLNGTEAMQSVNKKLYLRGKGNTTFHKNRAGVEWQLSAKAGCSGNIQTLIDWENPPTVISGDRCYREMFKGCTNLTTAPELPATTLTISCYYEMFSLCSNLTSAPALPATFLVTYCYFGMFYGCTSLITAPNLLATTLEESCYYNMFYGCSKLKVNTSSGNKIFTCPSNIPTQAVIGMFESTGGTFKGSPTSGNTYYWTE